MKRTRIRTRTTPRRLAAGAAALAVATQLALPATAAAHGLKIRADLPVPLHIFYVAGAVIMAVSFAMLMLLWKTPRFTSVPWRALPSWLSRLIISGATRGIASTVVLLLFILVVLAAVIGTVDGGDNIAPTAIFLHWWISIPVVSFFFGDVIRRTAPWASIARIAGIGDGPASATSRDPGYWPAAFFLVGFAWLELVYPTAAHVHALGALALLYTVITCGAMVVRGVEGWLDGGELFSTYGSLIARMSIFERRTMPDGSERLGLRPPLLGTTLLRPRPGLVVFTTLLIGTVSYDGLSRTHWWTLRVADATSQLTRTGVGATPARYIFGTGGLLLVCVFIWAAFEAAAWSAARLGGYGDAPHPVYGTAAQALAPSLLPIAAGYVVAHYFTYWWFGGQTIIPLASDPFGTGRDLFGTRGFTVDFSTIRANTVWYIQVGAIVIGHVLALGLAHDRALELAPSHRHATRSQLPLLALMVLYTVGGLYFLSGGLA